MAPGVHFELPRPSAEFTDGCALDVLVPQSSAFDINVALDENSPDVISKQLARIKQRDSLFFDENIDIYLVLYASNIERAQIRPYLSRLLLNIEVSAATRFSTTAKPGEPTRLEQPIKEVIYSGSLQGSEKPEFRVIEQKENLDQVVAIWKTKVRLSRPKVRIPNPYILIFLSGILQPLKPVDNADEAVYMQSQAPLASNLFQSFQYDQKLASSSPRLSSSKLLRVTPLEDERLRITLPLRNTFQKSFYAIAAVSTMVRLSRLHVYSDRPTLTGSLDFEASTLLDCGLSLDKVDLKLNEGTLESLSPKGAMGMPIQCQPGDKLSFLYRMVPEGVIETASYHKSNIRILDIAVTATLLVADDCHPELVMTWKKSVDFSTPLNPSFSDVTGPPIHRLQRPANISPVIPSPVMSFPASPGSRPLHAGQDVLPANDYMSARHYADSTQELGLTITFSGPENVIVGEVFQWTAFIINHTGRSRKLGLQVLPKRRRPDPKKMLQEPTKGGAPNGDHHACPAVVDQALVYHKLRSAALEPADLVSLSTDIMIGPLAPSACHTVDLKLVALASGVLLVEAVRVTDLATQEIVEIKDLPCIVASTPAKSR